MSVFDLPRVVYRDLRGIETEPRSDEEHLEAAIEWLYRSQDVTNCGGSAGYYSLLTGWSGPYPETSGYIVPTLYNYAEYSNSKEARRRAERMARWLLRLQFENGAFPEGIDPGPEAGPSVFNTGQILFGLVRAYKETQDEQFLQAAESASNWLASVQRPEGYWEYFDYQNDRHVYCSRVAWALLLVSKLSSKGDYYAVANNHLQWVLSQQIENGWFKYAGFKKEQSPFLHTIAYTLRGLLEAGCLLAEESYILSVKKAIDQIYTMETDNGQLKGRYNQFWEASNFYCLTGNAQIAIVNLRLASAIKENKYVRLAKKEIEVVKRHQMFIEKSINLYGGISGSDPIWGPYMRLRIPNWGVKFFVDALLLLEKGLVTGNDAYYHY